MNHSSTNLKTFAESNSIDLNDDNSFEDAYEVDATSRATLKVDGVLDGHGGAKGHVLYSQTACSTGGTPLPWSASIPGVVAAHAIATNDVKLDIGNAQVLFPLFSCHVVATTLQPGESSGPVTNCFDPKKDLTGTNPTLVWTVIGEGTVKLPLGSPAPG